MFNRLQEGLKVAGGRYVDYRLIVERACERRASNKVGVYCPVESDHLIELSYFVELQGTTVRSPQLGDLPTQTLI